MKKYVLKANYKGEILYYMNVICVTEQIECAEEFETISDAEKNIEHFKKMFFYEEPKDVEVIEVMKG